MSHSQGLSNNPYSEPNQPNSSNTYSFKIYSNIVLPSTPRAKGLFPVGLPVKLCKALLLPPILAT